MSTSRNLARIAVALFITLSLYLFSQIGTPLFPSVDLHPIISPDLFNGDNRHLTYAQCELRYPELYLEADRAEAYYAAKGGIAKEMVDKAEAGGHARLAIINNILYVKSFRAGHHSRAQAVLASVYATILTSSEPLPDVEFVIEVYDAGTGDWPHFALSRTAEQEALWLMPDFGFFSWPETGVGSYADVRRQTMEYESDMGLAFTGPDASSVVSSSWGQKTRKLFWRGAPLVEVRNDLLRASENKDWADIKKLNWTNVNQDEAGRTANHGDLRSLAEHCQYAFLMHVEGAAYSGRLKYLQQCRSVVITHPLQYIQHFHHLLNSIDGHPDQNIVEVPLPLTDHLGAAMEALLSEGSTAKVERIVNNSWDVMRSRYINPAANECYFRHALRAYANVQQFQPSIKDRGVAYESFVLMGSVSWSPH